MALYTRLSAAYSPRNEQYRLLRKHYFGDLRSVEKRTSSIPEVQEEQLTVYNLVNASLKRFFASLSASPPKVRAVPRSGSLEQLEIASRRTRYLEWIWQDNNMAIRYGQMVWLQSLLGMCPILAVPSQEKGSGFKISIGVPEYFFPMAKNDQWEEFTSVVYAYESYENGKTGAFFIDPTKTDFTARYGGTWTMNYWDKNYSVTIVDGKETARVKHDFGFVPWFVIPNMPIPHLSSSEGDFDQAIPMHEYINEQLLLQGQLMLDYMKAPIAVSSSKAVQVVFGDGRDILDLGPDGRAQFLTHPGTPPTAETLFIKSQQGFEDMVGVSSPSFGRDIPSGTTGPVIGALLGGFTGILGNKQLQIAYQLYLMNLAIQKMAEKIYAEQEFVLAPIMGFSTQRVQKFEEITVKPSEFGGWYQNQVIHPENPQVKSLEERREISLWQSGLQSKLTTMWKIGIEDPIRELQLIAAEKALELKLSTPAGTLPLPGIPGAALSPIPTQAAPQPGVSPSQEETAALLRNLGLGPEAGGLPAEAGQPEQAAGGSESRITIGEVQDRLRRVPNLKGDAWVFGQIASRGFSDRDVDIAFTELEDVETIKKALGDLASKANFTKMEGPPPGVTVSIKGVVPGGGLKPEPIKLFKFITPAKPEKKALQWNEFFSLKQLADAIEPGHTWNVSEKIDGIRAQLHKEGDRVGFFSDEGGALPIDRLDHLVEQARKNLPESAILDGEIVALTEAGEPKGHALTLSLLKRKLPLTPKEMESIAYKFWDVLYWKGEPVVAEGYGERVKLANSIEQSKNIIRVKNLTVSESKVKEAAKGIQSTEGVIIRATDSAYWATHLLYKVKRTHDVDVQVIKKNTTKDGRSWTFTVGVRGPDGRLQEVGKTFAQNFLDAKPGDIIRLNVREVSKRGANFFVVEPSVAKPKTLSMRAKKEADSYLTLSKIWEATRSRQV